MNLSLRLATKEDSEDIWRWRNDPLTRAMSFHSDPIDWDSHSTWYLKTLQVSDRILLIGVDDKKNKVGTIRFDLTAPCRAEVSFNLNPSFRGKGLGKLLLAKGIKFAKNVKGISNFDSKVKSENKASIAMFLSVGFEFVSSKGGMNLYRIVG